MNIAAGGWATFDALLFRSEQGRWANFVNGGCQIQLFQNDMGYVLQCRQEGQVKSNIWRMYKSKYFVC